jgi:hypothetical protein
MNSSFDGPRRTALPLWTSLPVSWQRRAFVFAIVVTSLASGVLALPTGKAAASKSETETVITTFRVKQFKEAEFAKVLAKAWPTYHRLGMVLDTPHVVLRGLDESGKTYFVEVLTWKDHDAPDNAPAEVTAIWNEMVPLCEARLGHAAIEFPEVQVVELPK